MRVRLQSVLFLAFLLIVSLLAVSPLWAQSTNTGTIVGTVTDPSKAVVGGATVTLTDTGTKSARTDVTNDAGRYIFVDVQPGAYELTISKQGSSTTKTQTTVEVGTTNTLNMSLQVGGGNVVVEVTAAGTELQTMNATVGNTLTSIAIDNLPSLGRDVSTFVELQPGVAPDGSVAGAVTDQSYFSLDGGNNTNDMDGSMSVYTSSYAGDPTGGVSAQWTGVSGPTGVMPTPQDSVEEFKVNTAGQTADFNSSAGAEIKVVTKRGTNAWHGTAYEYYKDNNWSSNSWQNNFNDVGLPSFHYNRFGGAVGGPLIPKDVLGGKTYVFFNYEGFRFPNSATIDRNVPSAALRLGLIQDYQGNIFNLNPYSVTYNSTTIPGNQGCASLPGGVCDPRGLGINPLVSSIWSSNSPQSNAACNGSLCDGANILGYSANVNVPQSSKFAVGRLDHDFSAKWHFMTSYRYYNLKNATTDQVDIGGGLTGDTVGNPVSQSSDPQQAWFWVAGLTTNITSNTTNDLHYSFLRNWWQWGRAGDVIQGCGACAGLGGALEIMSGQSQTQDLGPYNVNTQQTRTRFWDGHDQMLRDDVSMLKGNHLFQFGGQYQHNWNYHQRTDNGGGINYQPVYSLGDGGNGSLLPSGADVSMCALTHLVTVNGVPTPTPNINNCGATTAAALGIVSIAQIAYTRSGPTLALNPPLTPAYDQSTIPYYNVYVSDTWHMKPSFTLTYGLGWTLEMPPVEANGKQIELVDQNAEPISATDYLASRRSAALQGQVFNPEVGFALVGNTGSGLKYPYNPFYGEFSPRVAAAWNPHFDADSVAGKFFGHEDTVIRGGYGRVYGRLNGVDLVLVPLLGTGLIQPVQAFTPIGTTTSNFASCGANSVCAGNAFRVGPTTGGWDGLVAPIPAASPTLPQPDYPGFNAIAAGAGEALDPHFRPNVIDSFDLTVQRQISRRVTLEFGYIGRRITHEYQPINLNAVPYMMTVGGQSFSQAYANTVLQYCGGVTGMGGGGCAANAGAVTAQPFFESAINPSYCQIGGSPTTCTAAVVNNLGGLFANAQVWSLWSALDNGAFNFPRSMMNTPIPSNISPVYGSGGQLSSGVAVNAAVGHGNYNAGFTSLKLADWRGITAQSNFTYSKALGTGAVVQASSEYTPDDAFDLNEMYGRQPFDRKFVYNTFVVYQPPFFKGQNGMMGRVLGGWTFATVFTAGSGTPIEVYTTTGDGQEFGAGDNVNFFGNENSIPINRYTSGHAYYNQPSNALPVNIFKNGVAEASNWRLPILGYDLRDGGAGILNGLPYWNMDFSVKKSIRIAESVSMEFQGVMTNLLNHNQWLDPTGIALYNPGGFGALNGSAQSPAGGNRQIELGARVRF
jgi:Carboxypeptidase regulatory-like domain